MILHVINSVRVSLLFIPAFLDETIGTYFVLDLGNALLSALSAYEDLGKDAESFSRRHPFACWLSVFLNFFAGALVSNIILGDPVLNFLSEPVALRNVYLLTFTWWFVFHSPSRVGHKFVNSFPVKFLLSEMKEIYRSVKVQKGVSQILNRHPQQLILMVINGTVKGNGASFMSICARLVRGTWVPQTELLKPSFTTKLTCIAATIFVLNAKSDLIELPTDLLTFIIATVFAFCKAVSMLWGKFDPLAPIEATFSYLLLGGIWDSRIVDGPRKKTQ